MIVLDVTCRARVHETEEARLRHGCLCPTGWGTPYRSPRCQPPRQQTRYIPGRIENRIGPRRSTVTSIDANWVAVNRAIAGDRTLRLAATERDQAIDRLDLLGLSAQQIARRLGITMRTVQRRRTYRREVDKAH